MITESQMAVKLLYSLDSDNSTKFVAKPPAPFRVSVHGDFGIGFCRLDKCLEYMVSSCSEFAHSDYSVFSADFSEENAPLLSHGRLSNLRKSVETVSGKIKQNLLNQQIFEVQLYFKRFDEPPARRAPLASHAPPSHAPSHAPMRRLPPSSPPAAKRHHTAPAHAADEYVTNSLNPLDMDVSMMLQSYFPRKRLEKEEQANKQTGRKVPRCDNCQIFDTAVWRWGANYRVLCNPCGLWPRTHNGKMRPEKFWQKKKEKQPELWKPNLSRYNPADDAFAVHELTESELREAQPHEVRESPRESPRASPRESPRESSRESPRESPRTPESALDSLGSDPVLASEGLLSDPASRPECREKENIAPPEAPSTPVREPAELEIVGNDSHHKWMQRFIQGTNDGDDLFEAFLRSPSKHASHQINFDISNALSSSPPSSSSNVFDVSEQDLGSIGADWIFRSPEKTNAS